MSAPSTSGFSVELLLRVIDVKYGLLQCKNWLPPNYSFVFVLISLTSLVLQPKFFHVLTRLVRLINTRTKE